MLSHQKLEQLELIHQAAHKAPGAGTFLAQYDGRPVIVKRNGPELDRETAILRSVSYPGIPKVIDYMKEDGGVHFLVLEKLSGTPLNAYINLTAAWDSRPLAPQQAISITAGLAKCFIALKSSGYLYRDLNFGHILVADKEIQLVDHEWDVKINDVGMAEVDNEAGTWETMAPEEFVVGNTMMEASNVFTLGTVLLQLLTGKSPFYIIPEEVPDAQARRQATLQRMKDYSPPEISSEKLRQLLHRCLQFESTQRYSTLEEFCEALTSF